MERDFYLGRILTGRISSGIIHIGDKIHGLRCTDNGAEKFEEGKVGKLINGFASICCLAVYRHGQPLSDLNLFCISDSI